ncbi:MAG TPA: sigma-70 family RNA polymerase sigma factor, partial [Usitatibacter sp.]|nr:sigma-70 family RNA polymerase sigma factor [Usitatibacter sp.]
MSPQAASDDAALIAAALERDDRGAFAELVRRHQSQVRSVLRRLCKGDDGLADDLAQETFVLAWRNLRHFRFEARFSTWLYRIAINAWRSEARRKREVLLDLEDDAMPLGMDQHAQMPDIAARVDLARAMATLSDGERAAVVALEGGCDQRGVVGRRLQRHQAPDRVSIFQAMSSAAPISPGISPMDHPGPRSAKKNDNATPSATSTSP